MKALPDWIGIVLRFAGIVNAVWGLTFALFTDTMLRWAEMPVPDLLFSWKMTGLVSFIFGAAYFMAAADPVRHFLVIGTGFFIKLTGAVMVLNALFVEQISPRLAIFFTLKDAVWAIIFAIVLYHIFRAWQSPDDTQGNNTASSDPLSDFNAQQGDSLKSLSFSLPVYLVFLRHFGCTFCREAIGEVSKKKAAIEAAGMQIVFVHMGKQEEADQYFEKYGFENAQHISDPACVLYKYFHLKRGSFLQLFGLKSWFRGFEAGILRGYGVGKLVGDGFRMPGVFVLYKGQVIKEYRHSHAADRPDYEALASCELV